MSFFGVWIISILLSVLIILSGTSLTSYDRFSSFSSTSLIFSSLPDLGNRLLGLPESGYFFVSVIGFSFEVLLLLGLGESGGGSTLLSLIEVFILN